MPLYDFKCPNCGLEFEVSRPMSKASEPALCPKDSTPSERLWRATIVIGGSSTSESDLRDSGGLGDFGADDHGHSHGGHDHFH